MDESRPPTSSSVRRAAFAGGVSVSCAFLLATCGGDQTGASGSSEGSTVREALVSSPSGDAAGVVRIRLDDRVRVDVRVKQVGEPALNRPVWLLWLLRRPARGYPIGPLPPPRERVLCFTDGEVSKVRSFAEELAGRAKFVAVTVQRLRSSREAVLATRFGRRSGPYPLGGETVARGAIEPADDKAAGHNTREATPGQRSRPASTC